MGDETSSADPTPGGGLEPTPASANVPPVRAASLLLPVALILVLGALWMSLRPGTPEPRPDLTVRVIDDRGEPLAHYSLLVQPRFENHARAGESLPEPITREVDALDGLTLFPSLSSGPWILRVDRTDDPLRWSEDVEVVVPTSRTSVLVVPRNGRLSGIVRDAAGAPLGDARVDVYVRRGVRGTRASVTTDAGGRFVLDPAPSGKIEVVVQSGERPDLAQSFVVPPGGELEVELREGDVDLSAALETPSVFGRVVDDLGQAVAGYWLVLLPDAGPRGARSLDELPRSVVESSTRPDGSFALGGVEPGAWRVEVDSIFGDEASRFRWSEPVSVTLPSSEALELVVPRDGRLTGVVRDPDGTPLAGASVAVYLRRGRKSAGDTATSDAQGRFVLDPAPAGSLDIAVRAPGRLESPQTPVVVAPGAELDVALTMRVGATIEGRAGPRLEGEEAAQAGDPRWFLLQRVGAAGALRQPTDEDGSFRARYLEPGTWMVVEGSGEGYGLAPRPVEGQGRRMVVVQEGEVARLDMAPELRAPVELEGRVSSLGQARAGVFVSCNPLSSEGDFSASEWRGEGPRAESIHHDTWALTDDEGRFRLLLDGAGAHRIWVGEPGRRVLWRLDLPLQDGGGLELALPAGRLAGHVIDRSGRPVAGVDLILETELRFVEGGAETPNRMQVSNARGYFDFSALVGGDYVLSTALGEGFERSGRLLTQVIEGQTTEVFLEVE